jgi:hypothetical protein
VKAILEIEITSLSTFPLVVNEEKETIPVGSKVDVYCQDDSSIWAGAHWKGKVIGIK